MKLKVSLLVLLTFFIVVLAPFFGERHISFSSFLFENDSLYIVLQYRIPRIMLAFLAGAGLSLTGLVFQSLFCNVLATPYTLGVSTAASLGALLAISLGISFNVWIFNQTVVFAILFAVASLLLIYIVSRKYANGRMSDILLVGVALNFLFSSLIMLLQFRLDYLNAFKFMHWMFGSIRNISFDVVFFQLVILFMGVVITYLLHKELDLLSLGEEFAHSRGVNVPYVRWLLIVTASVVIGSIVAFFGPIAFIGLIVPNIARLIFGAVHKRLIFVVLMLGGNLLVVADVLSRSLFSPVELPVGIFSSVLGAIAFCFLVINRQH